MALVPDPGPRLPGLCCCPTLQLYASSSLDCTIRIWTAENRLLRLLQLNGAPQALTFCSNSGDLVLALGSRLCLVPHRLYLPTSYLVKVCGEHGLGRRGCMGRQASRPRAPGSSPCSEAVWSDSCHGG